MSARLLAVLFAAIASSAIASFELRNGESILLGRDIAVVDVDDPVLRFVEVARESALVRVTPVDAGGTPAGPGQLLLILPGEERALRLREAFSGDSLRESRVIIEVVDGRGAVAVSDDAAVLTPQTDATPSRRHAVRPGRPASQTSNAVIDKAEASGALSSETALLYRVYALFGDARLPQQFRGDDSGLRDSVYMAEVRDRFDQLSPQTQAILLPFFAPPAYKGSWANAKNVTQPAVFPTPPPCQFFADNWTHVDAINSPVRVWYRTDLPDGLAASRIATFIDTTVWTALTGLMHRSPMPDDSESCSGGNERLDLYLTDVGREIMIPYRNCVATPCFILLRRDSSDATVIHEIFHAFQYAFPMAGCSRRDYKWWIEASAQWAVDFVQKDKNAEQETAKDLLNKPENPLDLVDDKHEYGAYLIAFYVHRKTGDPNFVRVAWENCEKQPALEAVDNAIGGFDKIWPAFTRDNWNQEIIDDYRKWDRLYDTAHTPENVYIPVSMGGKLDAALPIDLDLPRLSATYKHYKFFGNDVRSVAFWNGAAFKIELKDVPAAGTQYIPSDASAEQKKGVHVHALIKIEGRWTEDDWTDRPFVSFCRDTVAERLEELVIIISNSEFKDRGHKLQPADEKPFLWTSNMGCWKWKGKTSYKNETQYSVVTFDTEVIWERKESTEGSAAVYYKATGKEKWTVSLHPPAPGLQCDDSGEMDVDGFTTLSTYNYIPAQGSFHRAYAGAGAPSQEILACGHPSSIGGWFLTPIAPIVPGIPGARFVTVNASGTVAADTDTLLVGGKLTWNFEAQRE